MANKLNIRVHFCQMHKALACHGEWQRNGAENGKESAILLKRKV